MASISQVNGGAAVVNLTIQPGGVGTDLAALEFNPATTKLEDVLVWASQMLLESQSKWNAANPGNTKAAVSMSMTPGSTNLITISATIPISDTDPAPAGLLVQPGEAVPDAM